MCGAGSNTTNVSSTSYQEQDHGGRDVQAQGGPQLRLELRDEVRAYAHSERVIERNYPFLDSLHCSSTVSVDSMAKIDDGGCSDRDNYFRSIKDLAKYSSIHGIAW